MTAAALPRRAAGLEVEALGRQDLPAALPDWRRLHEADPEATPFTSPAWARAWLDEWEPAARAWVLRVEDAGAVVGIAPFAIARRGPLRMLRMLGSAPGDYWDILADPAHRDRVVAAVAATLRRRSREWDVALVSCLPASSATLDAFAAAGLRILRRSPVVSPGMALPATYDAYLRSLPTKRRTDLRRRLRRLDEGELQLREVHDVAELPAAVARWQDLRSRQWQERGRSITRMHESDRFRRFISAAVQRLVPDGLAQVWEFSADGRLVGSHVNFLDDRTFYLYLGGFDPGAARLAIGKVAIAASIRASIEAGRGYYDFARGAEDYKYSYGATDRLLASAIVGHGHPRSRAALDVARRVRTYRARRARARARPAER